MFLNDDDSGGDCDWWWCDDCISRLQVIEKFACTCNTENLCVQF